MICTDSIKTIAELLLGYQQSNLYQKSKEVQQWPDYLLVVGTGVNRQAAKTGSIACPPVSTALQNVHSDGSY